MNPLVSVIIPAYNCAQYLSTAIQSAVEQTYSNIEVVVVNDGSPDNTDEVVQPFLNRIVYIKQENKGLSAARNVGFRASNGEFVCFLDADDILLSDKFEKQINLFWSEPDLGVVISGYFDVKDDGINILQSVYKPWHRDALQHLLNHEVFPPHAPLIRRSVLESSTLFPENIVTSESQEDWQLWLDLALNGVKFSSVPEPLCKYRRRTGSISSNPLKHLDGARRVVAWLSQHPKGKRYHRQIARLSGIVEMERVARSWQAGESELAITTLAQAFEKYPDYWIEPYTWLRLFTTSLQLEDAIKWARKPEPAWYSKIVLEKYIMEISKIMSKNSSQILSASAWLMLCDLAYSNLDDELRRKAIKKAWGFDWKVCLSSQGRPTTIRACLGPKTIARLKGQKILGENS